MSFEDISQQSELVAYLESIPEIREVNQSALAASTLTGRACLESQPMEDKMPNHLVRSPNRPTQHAAYMEHQIVAGK